MGEQKRNRSITVTFLKGFEEEHKYINKLKEKGINRSFWICQAIREKIDKEQAENNMIRDLEQRIKALEETFEERSANIVYIPKEEEEKIDKSIEDDLIRAAASFEF